MKALTTICIWLCLRSTGADWGPPLVLNDPAYVDGHEGAQLVNLVLSIKRGARQVTGPTLISLLSSKPEFVIIPELEVGDWAAALASSDLAKLQDYVFTTGGILLVSGANRFWRGYDVNLINSICGTSLEHNDIYCESSGTSFMDPAAAQGTPFQYGPWELRHASAVYCLKPASMPLGAKVIYQDSVQSVWVFLWQYGQGLVLFLGHDWHTPNSAWYSVLNASLHTDAGAVNPWTTTSLSQLFTQPTQTTTTSATPTQSTTSAAPTQQTTTNASIPTVSTTTVSTTTMTTTTKDFSSDIRGATTTTEHAGTTTTETIGVSTMAVPTTTTTATTLPPLCTPTQMHCPVPQAYASAKYEILGSETVPACQKKGPDAAPYFEFLIVECNQTRIVDIGGGVVKRIVTLMPVEVTGALILMKEPVMPILLCICSSPLAGTADNFVLTDKPVPPTVEFGGSYKFEPKLNFFPNVSFQGPLGQTDEFPLDNDRMYVEVFSATPDDVIGLQQCEASPSGAIVDPYVQTLLQSSCPAGPFDLVRHPSADNNRVRFSVLNFRFGGFDELYVTCTVIRCSAPPCGSCADAKRRRLSDEEPWFKAENISTLTVRMRSPLVGMVFPALVSPERMRMVWQLSPDVAQWAGEAPRANLSIFGCTAEPNTAFAGALERGLEVTFEGVAKPRVLRIFALSPDLLGQRRMAAEGASEVLQVEVVFLALTGTFQPFTAKVVDSLSQGGNRTAELASNLRTAFEAASLGGMDSAFATFGPVSQVEDPMVPQMKVSNPRKEFPVTVLVSAAAGGVAFLAVCVCLLLWRRSSRRKRAALEHCQAKVAAGQPQGKLAGLSEEGPGKPASPAEHGAAAGNVDHVRPVGSWEILTDAANDVEAPGFERTCI